MKQINQYITEKFKINSKTTKQPYKYFPETRSELIELLEEKLKEDKDADLNDIDVSKITDMSSLFSENTFSLDPHNIHIEKWDMSNVINISEMFSGCENFNCDISNWNVSNVKMMNYVFYDCKSFDCDLSKWNVGKVERWNNIFGGDCGIKDKEEYKPKFNWKNVK